MIGAQSGVNNSVPDGEILSGSPVMPHKNWLKASMSFARLPEMRRELSRMKKQIEELEKLIKEKE
jgi:UDP-3-O-[3-hydroxymyristoyl] glucosamine N-acyltransferase